MGVEEVPVCGKLPKKKKKTFPYNFILSLAILLPWTKMHVIVSLDKSPPWTKVSLDNCLLGLMSPRTNVSLDKCPLDNRLLGQLSPWTHGPWTNVSTPFRTWTFGLGLSDLDFRTWTFGLGLSDLDFRTWT